MTSSDHAALLGDAMRRDLQSEHGRNGNQRFVKDFKASLSPFVNSCGLLDATPAALAAVVSLGLAASSPSVSSLPWGKIPGDLTPLAYLHNKNDLRLAIAETFAKGREALTSLTDQFAVVSSTCDSACVQLGKICNDLDANFTNALDNTTRNEVLRATAGEARHKFERAEKELDDWLGKAIELHVRCLSSSECEVNLRSRSLSERMMVHLAKQARPSVATENAKRAASDLFEVMYRNQTRYDMVMQSKLPLLPTMRNAMTNVCLRSSFLPIATILHKISEAASTILPLPDSNESEGVAWVHSFLAAPQAVSQKFHDLGYLNAPFVNVILTFFLGYLANGPDEGVDWISLRDTPGLLALLGAIRETARFPTTSVPAKELDHVYSEVFSVLQEIVDVLESNPTPSTSIVGLEVVAGWRIRLRAASCTAAKLTTAISTIPGVSVNIPEPTRRSVNLPSASGAAENKSLLNLDLCRLQTDYAAVINSLEFHKTSKAHSYKAREKMSLLRMHLNELNGDHFAIEQVEEMLAEVISVVAFMKRQLSEIREFLTGIYVLIDVWLCCRTNANRQMSDKIKPGPFMQEVMFTSVYMIRSYFELVADMARSFDRLTKDQNMAVQLQLLWQTDVYTCPLGAPPIFMKLRSLSKSLENRATDLSIAATEPYRSNLFARESSLDQIFNVCRLKNVGLDSDTLQAMFAGSRDSRTANIRSLQEQVLP